MVPIAISPGEDLINTSKNSKVAVSSNGENSAQKPRLSQRHRPTYLNRDTFNHARGCHMNFDRELDARGLNCPLPILRAKKTLTEMQSGQVLRIIATDPGSVKDFQAFSKQTGNELLSQAENNKEFEFFIKRK
jgi:tRNA 2-thiouridine synthesizing protein A